MIEVALVILIVVASCIVRYRKAGWLPLLPMLICSVFIGALFKNILDSMTYLANHPQLSANQVGWFPGYWPVLFLTALLVIVATPIYLEVRARQLKAHAKSSSSVHRSLSEE